MKIKGILILYYATLTAVQPESEADLVLVYFSCQMVHWSIMDDRHLRKKRKRKKKKYYTIEQSEFELLPL